MVNLDYIDREILKSLQKDAGVSLEMLAGQLSISTNTCWRRVKRLEESGLIKARVALVDAEKLGMSLTVYVAIKTNDHSKQWYERFAKQVNQIEQVVEFYRMAGDVDYVLKVTCSSVHDYDHVYKKLICDVDIADVSASFAMECLKYTTEVPIKARAN
ncbi:Lrp/AsnC family transcriptional regulator [Ningiella sp. W23]|uniref:Lrp/AsnC family transcriptional regulator n=1 Tax=Ningiella sp. W23 TaxID=3023715 RepID=UPI003756FD4A